jgi:hypothetical protein
MIRIFFIDIPYLAKGKCRWILLHDIQAIQLLEGRRQIVKSGLINIHLLRDELPFDVQIHLNIDDKDFSPNVNSANHLQKFIHGPRKGEMIF